ncbi:MAG: CHRD domain-containing protein [Acidobacteriota bacterium]
MQRKLWIAALAIGVGLGWFGVPSEAQNAPANSKAAPAPATKAKVTTSTKIPNVFKGRLSKVPVDAKMVPEIIGVGNATATLNGSSVTIAGTFEGLGTPATIAQLRDSKVLRGMRGPVIGDLTIDKAATGKISGMVNLTSEQVTDLKDGKLYVQIHSAKGPEGHLWGWLLP